MKKRIVLLLFSLISIVISPLLFILVVYRNQINFDPVEFSRQYTQFLFGLASLSVGFILANVIWENRTKKEKVYKEKKMLTRFFRHINSLAEKGKKLLDNDYLGNDLQYSTNIDSQLNRAFHSMALTQQGVLLHYSREEVEQDQELSLMLMEKYWGVIVPSIEYLSTVPQIRGNTQAIIGELENIITASQEVVQALGK